MMALLSELKQVVGSIDLHGGERSIHIDAPFDERRPREISSRVFNQHIKTLIPYVSF